MTQLRKVQLGEVARFIRGITFKPTDTVDPFSLGSVVCMRTKNVQMDLDQADLIAVPKSFVKRNEQFLSEGDILVSSANSWELVGKCSWVPALQYDATAGGFISILRGDSNKINARYLYYWLSSPTIQHNLRHCGRQTTNISNLNFELALTQEIALPIMTEQKRIALILDKADAIRRKRQQAIKLADDLLRATFLDMFGDPVTNPKGWPTFSLGEVSKVSTGTTPPSEKDGMFGGNIPFITPGDLENGDEEIKRFVTEEGSRNSRTVRKGATLVCCIGATIGKIGIAQERSTFNQQINAIEWYETVNDLYGFGAMSFLRKLVTERAIKTTLPILKKSEFETINIPVPPPAIQRKYAKIFHHNSIMKAKKKCLNNFSNILFNSLTQRAFRGEL